MQNKTGESLRSFHIASLILFIVPYSILIAQVHIQDTISISPQSNIKKNNFTIQGDYGFVVPKSGTLMVWPYYVLELSDTKMPDWANIQVFVNGVLKCQIKLDTIPWVTTYNDVWASYNSCTGQSASFIFTEFVVSQNYGDPAYFDSPPWAFPLKVITGDILNFVFNGTYRSTPYSPPGDWSDYIRDYGGEIYMMGTVPDYLCWEEEMWSNAPADDAMLYLKYMDVKPKVNIVNHAPWSIWPALLPGGITRSEANNLSGYDPERSFTISVTDGNGNPLKNTEVEINSMYHKGSGGHMHEGSNNLIPSQSLQGIFSAQGKQGNSLELTTDDNGIAVVESYTASRIAGNYLITASLKSDPTIKDTVNLTVQVPGLVNFRDLIFIPNGQKPYTFSQSAYGAENHPDNDWCTTAMGESLFGAILDFYNWSGSLSGGGTPIIISLNDMSLAFGGLFDGVYGNWQSPHALHRVGRSVDINNTAPFQIYDPKHPKVPIMTYLGVWLEKWMNAHGGYRIIEGKSVHYEFYKAN